MGLIYLHVIDNVTRK